MKCYLYILSLLLVVFCAHAQERHQYRFKRIDVEDGLSQNSVNDILQDSDGYIWIATQEGLNRFDGYSFVHYKPDNTNPYSISDYFIWGLLEDHLGYLWFCSRNALNRMDRKTGKIIKIRIDDTELNQYAININIKKDKLQVLFGGNKSYSIDLNQPFSKPVNYVSKNDISCKKTNLHAEKTLTVSDSFYIHKTSGKIVLEKNNKLSELNLEKPIGSIVMYSDLLVHDNLIWIGDYNGLTYTDFYLNPLKKHLPGILSKRKCISLELDIDKKMWVGTDSGVYVIDTKNNTYSHVVNDDKNNLSIPSNSIQCIYKDRDDNIWIGTAGKGLCIYNPETDKFKFLGAENGIRSDMLRTVCYNSKNELWIGNTKGIEVITIKSGKQIGDEKFLVNSINNLFQFDESFGKASCIKEDTKGRMWLGIIGKGLFIIENKNNVIKSIDFKSEVSNYITDIVFDKGSNAWVTTYYGIFKIDDNFGITTLLPATTPSVKYTYFLSVYIDSKETIWFGHNHGFCKLEKGSSIFKQYLHKTNVDESSPSFNFITSFQEDKKGNLWIATYGGGINKFNLQTEKFIHFNTQNGLSNNICGGLIADNKNNLWIATNDGISFFDTRLNRFTNYNSNDGIIFKENSINGIAKNKYGELFFCTSKGLVVIDPEKIPGTEKITYKKPVISSIQVNYEKIEPETGNETYLPLKYTDKILSFEFTSLNYKNPEGVIYAFKMEGVNKDWVYTNYLKRTATYSTLPDGNYTFMVKAKANNSDWSEPARIMVKIYPPFWKTWWFITLVIAMLVVLIYAVSKYFISKKIKEQMRQMEIKDNIQKERVRISRDLHDNVGASITYLISSLDNVHYQSQKGNIDPKKIDQLSDFARNTMRQLRDTIWVMDKDEIELNDFKSRLVEFSSLMMSSSEIKIQITAPETEYKLKPNIAINLYRIIQETINNTIKHANAKTITIKIDMQDKFTLSIADDGTGFDTNNLNKAGYGIKNIMDRCKEIQATCKINSSLATGTSFEIEMAKN